MAGTNFRIQLVSAQIGNTQVLNVIIENAAELRTPQGPLSIPLSPGSVNLGLLPSRGSLRLFPSSSVVVPPQRP